MMKRRYALLASGAAATLVTGFVAVTLPAEAAVTGCRVSYGEGYKAHLLSVTP